MKYPHNRLHPNSMFTLFSPFLACYAGFFLFISTNIPKNIKKRINVVLFISLFYINILLQNSTCLYLY